MAARLEIEVKQVGGFTGGGGGAGQGFTTADVANLQRGVEQTNRLLLIGLRGAKDIAAEMAKAGAGLATGLASAEKSGQLNASRLGLSFQRNLEQAGVAGGKVIEREVASGFTRGAAAGARQLGQAGRTFTGAFSRFGAESSSAFGVAFSGGLLNGNLLRGSAGLAGAVTRLGGQLGQGLAQTAGAAFNLVPVIGSSLSGISKVVGGAFSIAGSLGGVLANAGAEIAGALGDAVGTGLKITLGAAVAVGFAGVRLALKGEALEPAFEKFAKVTGDDVPSALAKLRTATNGTVSDLDLMRSSNAAAALGAAGSVEQFARLANVAVRLGRNVGRDANDAINDFAVGIGRASPRILDNVGIVVKLDDVYEKFAGTLGVATDDLTQAEKHQALFNEVLKQGEAKLAGVEERGATASESMKALGASVENATKRVGEGFLPVLKETVPAMNELVVAVANFIARESGEPGTALANGVSKIKEALKDLADFFDRAKSEDLWEIARLGAEELWIRFRAGAEASFEFVRLQGLATYADLKAAAVESVTPGIAADDSRLVTFAKDKRAEGNSFRAAAGAVSFAPTGAGADRVGAIRKQIAARIADVQGRPAAAAGGSAFIGPTLPPAASPAAAPLDNPLAFSSSSIGNGSGGSFGASEPGSTFTAPASAGPRARPERIGFDNALNSLSAAAPQASIGLLGPILAKIAESITHVGEDAANFADGIKKQKAALAGAINAFEDADLAQATKALGESITGPIEDEIALFSEIRSEVKSQKDDARRQVKKAGEELNRLGSALAEGIAEINAKFDGRIAEVRDAVPGRLASIQQEQVGARTNELISGVGGLGADESGIPSKFKRAAAKERRRANKERKHSLNQLGAGLGTDDLAANGGAKLQEIFAQQAQIETSGSVAAEQFGAIAEANAEIARLEAERIEVEAAFAAEIAAKQAEQIELMKQGAQGFKDAAEELKAVNKDLADIKARLKDAENALQAAASARSRSSR